MKNMKKIFALVLVALLVVANVAAFAANQTVGTAAADKGSITITNPVKDQYYYVYKIFDATIAEGGASNGISYKSTAAQEAISGFSTYFSVDANHNVSITNAGKDSSDATKLSAAAVSWIKANLTVLAGSAVATGKKTDDSGNLQFLGLDYGYYYIDSTNGTVVTIDSTTPDQSVTDKNPTPELDKDIASVNGESNTGANNEGNEYATASIGDTINYTVAIKAQKGAENYIYHDKMSVGLTLDTNTAMVVKVGNTPLQPKDATHGDNTNESTEDDYDYEVTKFANNNPNNGTTDNITIVFAQRYLDSISEETTITITYSAILNESAVIESTGNPNTATLDYGHNPDTDHNTTPPDSPRVYTFKFQLVKDNAEDKILDGAKFKVYDSTTGGTEIKFVQVSEGVYRPAKADEVDNAVEIEAGTPVLQGLNIGTYYFEETQAPEGYNLLVGRVKVEITAADNAINTPTTWTASATQIKVADAQTASAGVATINEGVSADDPDTYVSGGVEVVNQKGTTLPTTGGIGTTIFYVAGGILVLAAVILLVTKRRMGAND